MNNFDEEISLNPYFKLWDRGDGIGEIYLFNSIVAYIHGTQQIYPEDYYHYDEDLETYVAHDVEFEPVSCFPGVLQSSSNIFEYFKNQEIDSIEILVSLLSSISTDLLPPKPKGSIFDVFSQQEKFLLTKSFDFEVIKNGVVLNEDIANHFKDFSIYLKDKLSQYPEIKVSFIHHSPLNGNVYFLYQINQYYLHLVFNDDDKIIFGSINKSSQMKGIVMLECNEKNYEFIFQQILEKLKISPEIAQLTLSITEQSLSQIPRGKSKFINELIENQLSRFTYKLSHTSSFVLERQLQQFKKVAVTFVIDRKKLVQIVKEISIFDLDTISFISLLINDYFNKNEQHS